MKKELDELEFTIATELARAERSNIVDAEERVWHEKIGGCLPPLRARAIALGAEATPIECSHIDGCGLCASLVKSFRSQAEVPAVFDPLLDQLRKYSQLPAQFLQKWVEVARANARIFAPGLGESISAPGDQEVARSFIQGDLSIHLDMREEIGQFVVEVSSSNDAFGGLDVTVLLIGETADKCKVNVRLEKEDEGGCYGVTTVGALSSEGVSRLGAVIAPLVVDKDGKPTGI